MELTNKSDTARAAKLMLRIRWLTALFIFGLVVSGVTAIPLKWELDLLLKHCGEWLAIYFPQISEKLIGIHGALKAVDETMPFLLLRDRLAGVRPFHHRAGVCVGVAGAHP